MKPKLTIGTAAYDDPQGVIFTMQSLRIHHAASDQQVVELLVVDNKPDAADGDALRAYLKKAAVRYVPMPHGQGTSAPRQRIFDEANGEAVLVLDAHVLLVPGAIERLIAFYDANPDCRDLITGPLIGNNGQITATHYNPGWRSEMWGMWGKAWRAPNGEIRLAGDPQPESTALGINPDDDFVIPGMGLGLFSCRRAAWVNFHPQFRGFGGAEQYIHEKFRQRGNGTRSLGFLKWWHRFAKIGGHKYPLRLEDKLANVILGYRELGLPLDDVRRHFVDERKRLTADAWEKLVADPTAGTVTAQPTLEDLYDRVRSSKGAFDQHMPMLRKLAEQCEHVTEFSRTKGSTVAIAAAMVRSSTTLPDFARAEMGLGDGARTLRSWNADPNTLVDDAAKVSGHDVARTLPAEIPPADPTDLLFISSAVKTDWLAELLERFAGQVRHWIVLHDTLRNPVAAPLTDFMAQHPEWFVAGVAVNQGGMVIFSRDEQDRPEHVIHAWPPGYGPGTELKKILESLGIEAGPTCDCRARANQMDIWGVEGCREHRERIIEWMREGQTRWGWKDRLAAAARAVQSGLAFKLNPLDPFPSLVDEAIRRAAEASDQC